MSDVKPSTIAVYDHPSQFEPLLPGMPQRLGPLAGDVLKASYKLQGRLSPDMARVLRELVRAMNSYYSNRIEGQSTHPQNIDKALRKDFSAQPDTARKQRIALAHMEAEQALEDKGLVGDAALHSEVLLQAHAALYGRLEAPDRLTDEGRPIDPGQLRNEDVAVGRHHPPVHTALGAFLARADKVYEQALSPEGRLIAIACAHHRLMWVHPFLDGNGRACRLQTHAALFDISQGLWSVNRGLARNRESYYLHLAEADMGRKGDLDGRGQLSESALVAWCTHFLKTCLDQASFMEKMLDVEGLKTRVATLMQVRMGTHPGKGYRQEAILPLQYVMSAGPVTRGEFTQMMGLDERTARKSISQLLGDGLLLSDSHRAPLRPGLPLDALGILFPSLYPEADAANI